MRKRSNKGRKRTSPKWKNYLKTKGKEEAKELYRELRIDNNEDYSDYIKKKRMKDNGDI